MKFVIALFLGLVFWSFAMETMIKEHQPTPFTANTQTLSTSSDTLCDVYIPNAFTPDGNENNNVLKVFTACEFDAFEFRVYNRAGDILFISKDPNMAWDGTYKGSVMQTGTYAYTVEYVHRKGEPITLVGHISLLK